jgi:hypothetical protein
LKTQDYIASESDNGAEVDWERSVQSSVFIRGLLPHLH